MNKLKSLFRTKGFYAALTLGAVACAVLMGIYEYRDNKEKFLGTESVDLNKPYAEGVPKQDGEVAKTPVNSGEVEGVDSSKKEQTADKPKDAKVEKEDLSGSKKDDNAQSTTVKPATSSDAESTLQAFDESKDLIMPVTNGTILLPYSMDTTVYFETLGVYKCNPAVLISGEEGASVSAAYGGTVLAIDDTKEYGTVISVDMGNGYVAKYGQVMNTCVSVGDKLIPGQRLADIAPVSPYYDKEGTHLYFSLTKDGIPVNPMLYVE